MKRETRIDVAAESGPLSQFTIERLVPLHIGGLDVSFTNSSLLMMLTVILGTVFLVYAMRGGNLVPNRLQSIAEILYEMVDGLVVEHVGPAGRPYFPFLFTLFLFILLGNLLGMVPWSFTFTSHVIVTFALAAFVFLGVTLIGVFKHGFKFFALFVPHGVPWPLLILLVPIEMLSYCIRPFTLAIRLFANMMAGHTMLFIFASFVTGLGLFGFLPVGVDVFLVLLEFLVAALQAYVFLILSCLYLKDAIHLH
jgi:F-type H+-transporting ATPase subunit a